MSRRNPVRFLQITAWLFAFVLLFNVSAGDVLAAESSVTYTGRTEAFVFKPGTDEAPEDLFVNLKNVMPGDVLTQRITVKNAEANGVNVKIYLRSHGGTPETEEFLSQMKLSVKIEDGAELFSAPANETAGLTEWREIGFLYSGGEVHLDLTLEVPIEMDNRFQNAVGKITWEFMAEEYEAEPDDPEPSKPKPSEPEPPAPEVPTPNAPSTGDNNDVQLWSLLMMISVFGLFIMKQKSYRVKK